MPTSASGESGTDTNMVDVASSHRTTGPRQEEIHGMTEARIPVLLQWKDREMADDLSKLMMIGIATSKKANAKGGDVKMKDV
jgi:hypothetical protein